MSDITRTQAATAAPAASYGPEDEADDDAEAALMQNMVGHFKVQPTKKEIAEMLKSKTVVGTMPVKKEILESIFAANKYRDLIFAKLPEDAQKILRELLPLGKAKKGLKIKGGALGVAEAWIGAEEILRKLANNSEAWGSSRSDSNLRSTIIRFLKNNETGLTAGVNAAKNKVLKQKESVLNTAQAALSDGQRLHEVGYCGSGFCMPVDEALRECPYCKHKYLDMPSNALEILERNRLALERYEQAKADFDQQKSDNPDATRSTARGGKTTRALVRPTAEVIPMRCCCSLFKRVQMESDIGSTCPIKCKDEDGKPYGYDTRGASLCPVCTCTCTAVVPVRC